jgi:hypothetical protein
MDRITMSDHASDIKTQIAGRIQATPDAVWTPVDFLDLGSREVVDKTLQRLIKIGIGRARQLPSCF